MPTTVTVWAVELGRASRLEEVEGTLALGTGELVFRPRDERRPVRRFAFAELVRVRRLRGSPVLLVSRRAEDETDRTAFYFVRPPPLAPAPEARRLALGPLGGGGSPRRVRRRNASYLGWSNREKKQELREWEEAVNAALAAAGSGS